MQPEAIGIALWNWTVVLCGYCVAHLDMTDPSQQCPSAWREYNTKLNQFRACGRPVSNVASYPSQIFPISHQYSKVCGRVIAIQVASPDAFHSGRDINEGHNIARWHKYYTRITSYYLNACPCDYSGGIQHHTKINSDILISLILSVSLTQKNHYKYNIIQALYVLPY